MPRRKSDATEGDVRRRRPDAPADDAARAEPSPPLSTPDEAAEPGSPDTTGAPPEAADPAEAIEPYRDPEIVTPEVVAAEERAAADEPALVRGAPRPSRSRTSPRRRPAASLASKVLVGLVLLLLGAGLALWGAPKLAPHLPSGMAGVADWLTPGVRDAEARIADARGAARGAARRSRGPADRARERRRRRRAGRSGGRRRRRRGSTARSPR